MVSVADALTVGYGTFTTILSFLISYQAYRAYRFTGRRYLVNLSVGFILLGVSYYIVGFLLTSVLSSQAQEGLAWLRLVIQTVGFGLLASAYYSRSRPGEVITLASLLAVAGLAVPVLNFVTPPSPTPVDEYLYLLCFILALYVLTQATRGYVEKQDRASFLVSSGFLFFAFSQFSWFLWSAESGAVSLLFALLFRLFGLTLLVQSFVEMSKTNA